MPSPRFRPPHPAICFLLTFLFGLGLVVLIAWIYANCLPKLPDYDRWEALYRLVFYGLVVLLVLVLIKVIPSSSSCARAISWPFSSIRGLLPKPEKPWDWLEIIGGTTLLGILASVISFLVTQSTQENALRLQNDKERQQLLTDYMKDMTQLIKGASYANMGDELKVAISSRTLNTLEALEGDGSRQGYALRFASRAFPNFTCPQNDDKVCQLPSNISLHGISLKGYNIEKSNTSPQELLVEADLVDADLEGSDFAGANLSGAKMAGAILSRARFGSETVFNRTTQFANAKLDGAEFLGSDLSKVRDLQMAHFSDQSKAVFSYNTKFNEKFASKICEYIKKGWIGFTEQGSGKEANKLKMSLIKKCSL